MEAIVLLMVCLSPWVFGAVHPISQFVLFAGVALLLLLWAARLLVEWQLSWEWCPVTVCLAILFLVGGTQLVPLSHSLLSRLSPTGVQLIDQLLPADPETLPLGGAETITVPTAGSTISLYPAATRASLIQLLAAVLLFVVVRQNLASTAALRRLSVVAVFNGSLLALFGLIQVFTSRPNILYWSFRSEGRVFGPFICRNHFPFYLNLCIGLGVGLLLSLRTHHSGDDAYSEMRHKGRSRRHREGYRHGGADGSWLDGPLELLRNPKALWVCGALALMLSSVVFCLSRGGVLALLGGCAACLVLRILQAQRPARLETVGLILVLTAGLLAWFGVDAVAARLETIWSGEALQESRAPVWSQLRPLVRDFGGWGSGYGTLQYVEPLHRSPAQDPDLVVDHAHNEYLEAIIEGGVPRLALSLLAIGLLYWLGWRALRRYAGRSAAGLALGALFGITAVVIHSVGDFGLHTPAITVLFAVLAAQLSALGASRREERRVSTIQLWGLAPILGAAVAVFLGLLLYGEGWREARAERFRLAAERLAAGKTPAPPEQRIDYLKQAVLVMPENALLHVDLAEVHFQVFKERLAQLQAREKLVGAFPAVLSLKPVHTLLPSWLACQVAEEAFERELLQEHLGPALAGYFQARALCPLLYVPHVRIAASTDWLPDAEPKSAYLERARLLRPGDAEIAYACGLEEIKRGQLEEAWHSWHQALASSDQRFNEIFDQAARHLGPEQLANDLLPDKPGLLIRAAGRLDPKAEDAAKRRPFYEKAVHLLDRQPGALNADEQHAKAVAFRALGKPEAARSAYRAALAQEPKRADWHFELGQLLYEMGERKGAHDELVQSLIYQSDNQAAKELDLRILQEMK
jgi:O-antigen ligase